MEAYNKAYQDFIYYPVNKIFDRSPSNRGLFSFGSNNHESAEQEILHEKPTIIVLREDLDYYCVPQSEFIFDNNETSEELLYHIMAQVKSAAGSYLTSKGSIFQGLYSSNRLRKNNRKKLSSNQHDNGNNNHNNVNGNDSYDDDYYAQREKELGPAEQHLKDMLCSSGFQNQSVWGNRFQEPGKTVISSLSLCRIANETTESFRKQYSEAKARWDGEQKQQQQFQPNEPNSPFFRDISLSPTQSLTPTESNQTIGKDRPSSRTGRDKRKSRLSALADNVRSRSGSRQRSQSHQRETPKLYDLMPKPDINVKLLLFWRKPARKCWWGEEDLDLDVEIYGSWDTETRRSDSKPKIRIKTPTSPNDGLTKMRIPVRLHIRRVWTLELSVVGVQ
ncbi:hypothetical protein LQ764DRAFT_234419 [Zygosaccharomyces rouxii]|nr:hypothetical protein LQ764DRAFT_234419 [Zygosaccharomyces rouxii]